MTQDDDDASFSLRPAIRRQLAQDTPPDIPGEAFDEASDFSLYISDLAMIGIRRHACTDSSKEVGGVLIGRHYKSGDRIVVVVNEHRPLPSSSSSRTHFTYGEESYRQLHRTFQPSASRYVVGWFHSHPRFGDPFMSSDDIRVHKEHFREPWHVSFVVGADEWSLPVGYWRMVDGQLLEISSHFIRMTTASSLGEQSRRYIRACVNEEKTFPVLLEASLAAMKSLNLPHQAAIDSVFQLLIAEDAVRPHRTEVCGVVETLIRLAKCLAVSREDLSISNQFSKVLEKIRFQTDSFEPVALSENLGSLFVVGESRCLSLTPPANSFSLYDLEENLIVPAASIKPLVDLIDLDVSQEGDLWVLSNKGELGRVANAVSTELRRWLVADLLLASALPGEPLEMSLREDSIWIRTDAFAVEYGRNDKITQSQPGPGKSIPLPSENTVLLRRNFGGADVLIGVLNGELFKVNTEGMTTCVTPLPEKWKPWKLVMACPCTLGFLLLFDNGNGRSLGVFDADSLSFEFEFIDATESENQDQITSISADLIGRAYVKKGKFVHLITDSGVPNMEWYASSKGYRTVTTIVRTN